MKARKSVTLAACLWVAALLTPCPASASAAEPQSPKAGVVTQLRGVATVARGTTAPARLAFRDDVFVGDRIGTEPASVARVLLGGRAVLTIRERSSLTIGEGAGGMRLRLDAGRIAYSLDRARTRAGEVHEIETPNALARLSGTVVTVEVTRGSGAPALDVTRICTLAGTLTARAARGAAVEVRAGRCVTITGDAVSPTKPAPKFQDDLGTGDAG